MTPKDPSPSVVVRNTRPDDFDQIIALCRRVYPHSRPWARELLASHLDLFPEGQFVAEDTATGKVVGMAASLIIDWDGYAVSGTWADFTGQGYFTNHDPIHGRTLYGAEVMVDPDTQGMGIGKKIYKARFDLCRRLNLRRIRAGARLRGYHAYADRMSPEEYVVKVVNGEIGDPTLSFQLKQGFRVIAVVKGYLRDDPSSQGYAAVIEWINHSVAQRRDYAGRDPRFGKRRMPGREATQRRTTPGRGAAGTSPN